MIHLIQPGLNKDWVKYLKPAAILSIVFIVLSIVGLGTKGLNYGIDFTGGAEVQLKAPTGMEIGKLRSTLDAGGLKNVRVVQIGEAQEGTFLVKVAGDESNLNQISAQVDQLLTKAGGGHTIQRVDVVGPAAGKSLRQSGFLSMLYALICILIYVTIRFDARYAPGAVLALFHDTMIVLGVFVLTQKQFDLQILAAILALIGYSNNDTIIVFDRVRETLQLHPNYTIEQAVNRSVNETLGRTILTSLTTFLVVLALYLLGGSVIRDFAFTFMVGIIVGGYSSVFIASSLVISMTRWQEKRNARLKSNGGGRKKGYTVRPEPKFQ